MLETLGHIGGLLFLAVCVGLIAMVLMIEEPKI